MYDKHEYITVVAKKIGTLVFSPAKKMVLSQLFLSFAVVYW